MTSVWRSRLLVPTLVFMGLLVAIVSSLGAPLIPTIATAYGVTLSKAQWILTAALLTGALATPVMGKLADGPHQRRVVVVTLSTVLVGCVLAALSKDFVVLVAGRALQGFGLGLLPVNMAVARRYLPPDKAAQAIATLSITTAVGVGLGYPLTGLVAQALDFHAAYWFGAVPVAGALVATIAVLPGRSGPAPSRFDGVGASTLTLAVIGISLVLSEGDQWGWTSGLSLAIVLASLLILCVWIRHERTFSDPLVELRHLGHRAVLAADSAGFLISIAMYLFIPVVVVFVQVPATNGFGFGSSIVVSGLVLVPLSVTTFASSRFLVVYERRFGSRSMVPVGALVAGAAAAFFALDHAALWEAFVAMGLGGLGLGFTFAAMPGFIIRAVPSGETGSATGFYQVLRNIGLSVGSALGVAVLATYTRRGDVVPSSEGFVVALLLSAGLCFAAAILGFALTGASQPPRLSDREEAATTLVMQEEARLSGAGLMLSDEHERLD